MRKNLFDSAINKIFLSIVFFILTRLLWSLEKSCINTSAFLPAWTKLNFSILCKSVWHYCLNVFYLNITLWNQGEYLNAHLCLREAIRLVYFYFYCLRKVLWFVYFYFVTQHLIVIWSLNFQQVKFYTFINLMKNIVIVLVWAKCLKLITLEENITRV